MSRTCPSCGRGPVRHAGGCETCLSCGWSARLVADGGYTPGEVVSPRQWATALDEASPPTFGEVVRVLGGSDVVDGDGYAHRKAHYLLEAAIRPPQDGDVPKIATKEFTFGTDDGTTLKHVKINDHVTVVLDRNGRTAEILQPPARTAGGGDDVPLVGLDATARRRLWEVAVGGEVRLRDVHDTPQERAKTLRDAHDLQIVQTSELAKSYEGDPSGKNLDADVALLEAIADEYAGVHGPREWDEDADVLCNLAVITTKVVREVLEDDDRLDDVVAAWDNYGNLKGSNELGKHRLAALIDVGAVLGLGLGGLLLVIVIMVLIRPAVALIATYGVEKFTGPERLFLGAMGPRGIIPASVATLFAIELELAGNVAAGQTLLGTVFVVILATDVIEAGFARQIADRLGVTPMRTIIVGGGRVGRALATRLENSGEFVVIVEQDEERKVMAEDHGFTVIHGDGTEGADLRQAGIENAKVVVAATGKDDVNLLVSQIAKTKFGIADLYAKVNEPENDDAFESLGVAAVNAPDATAFAIENAIERQELANWMYDHGDDHAIREVTVTSQSMIGKSIRDLNDAIPGGCLIAELGEGVDAHVPDSDEKLEYGDKVTFLGDSVAVERAANRFHPHE